jgi:glycosyltransferase involved in cell wall biosynthesis
MEKQLLDLGVSREKIHYNVYGVDTNLFRDGRPDKNPPTFIAVGRFVDKKAPQLTLLAFRKVLDRCSSARLIMIADGPLLESCRQIVHALKMTNAVEFLGPKKHNEVAKIMNGARAFVQHSVTTSHGDAEGTPVGVLEAGSSGLPVVSTRHAGIRDVVLEGKTGFLVDEFDVAGMAEQMIALVEQPERALELGRNARKHIEDNFSLEESINNLWRIILNCIKEG